MRKFILLCLLVFTVSSVVFAQQMTDEQVILYVQEAQSQGKTQQEMLVELMKKGSHKRNKSREYSLNIQANRTEALRKMPISWEKQTPVYVRRKLTRTKTRISLRMNPAWIISVPKSKVIKGLRAKSAQATHGYGNGGE